VQNFKKCGTAVVCVFCLVACEGDSTPNESDRNSQLTGSVSSRSLAVVDSLRETISEDSRYTAKYLLDDSNYINIQIENQSSTVAEILTLDEPNYNRYVAGSSYQKIENLSFTPLAASYTSQWTLLEAGVYYTVVDNTDRGSVKPPWNGVNDRVTFTMSVLVSPAFNDAPVLVHDDAVMDSGIGYAQLLETSIVHTVQDEGF